MKSSDEIEANRAVYLTALRSGDYIKGAYIVGQDKPPPYADGFCAIGLPYTLFSNNKGVITKELWRTLRLTKEDMYLIQNEWNDSELTFPQIADLIEHLIFKAGLVTFASIRYKMACREMGGLR